MVERTNEEWLRELRLPSPQCDKAISDIRSLLIRGLGFALSNRSDVNSEIIEDIVQDALMRILSKLDTFRGESRFKTWSLQIAVNLALTELRRRRWRDVSLEDITDSRKIFSAKILAGNVENPEKKAIQREFIKTLKQVISRELTERQKIALIAVQINGMPLEEVARRMGTNRNSLYKLMHDARKNLKKAFLKEGLTPQEILGTFS